MQTDRTLLDYAALRATPVRDIPFRHVVVPNFLPPEALREVVGGLPELASGGSYPLNAVSLGATASRLMQEIEGPLLRQAIADKFSLNLDDAPSMATLRGRTREKDGRIHCDSVAKRVTALLYMNPATEAWAKQEGCLRLLNGPDNIEDYAVEVPPVDGTLLVFPNGPTTWHGHRQFVGRRYAIQLNYMTNDSKARSELRRHRFSALVKKLTA